MRIMLTSELLMEGAYLHLIMFILIPFLLLSLKPSKLRWMLSTPVLLAWSSLLLPTPAAGHLGHQISYLHALRIQTWCSRRSTGESLASFQKHLANPLR